MTEKKQEYDFEELGRWKNLTVTKWKNKYGDSYNIRIGYKKGDKWFNKKISLFVSEIGLLKNAVSLDVK